MNNNLKKLSPFFYLLSVNKNYLLIPSLLLLIIFNIYNFFSPKLYSVKLNANVIDTNKFIKLNSFVKKNKFSYEITSTNLANQIADSFVDYEEIEDAVKKYSEINNNAKLTKNQKKELIMKLTQSFILETVNDTPYSKRLEEIRPYKLYNKFDFLIQFKTEDITNSIIILKEAIKKINHDVNETNKNILNDLINARLSDLETDLTQKKTRNKIIKNNITEKNMRNIAILEKQLNLINLNSQQEQKNRIETVLIEAKKFKDKFLHDDEYRVLQGDIAILEKKLNLINLNSQQEQKNKIETDLIEAKKFKDKFLHDDEYRVLQGDIEILNSQITNIKDTFNRVMTSSPFYKNEKLIDLNTSVIIIDDFNELSKIIRKNLSVLSIGFLFGLSIIFFREKQNIFK
jgi:hypothetical protein